MTQERNCKSCIYYKDEYCEVLDIKPCYPQKGCDYFSKRKGKSDVLDKIRVEIMALRNRRAEEFDIDSDVFDDRVILRSDVLKILDKYKEEIEPQESDDT